MKRSPLVLSNSDELLIDIRATGIHPMVIGCDGLTVIRFKSDRRTFMRVTDAIAWHEKELRESRGISGDEQILDALKAATSKVAEGQVIEE